MYVDSISEENTFIYIRKSFLLIKNKKELLIPYYLPSTSSPSSIK